MNTGEINSQVIPLIALPSLIVGGDRHRFAYRERLTRGSPRCFAYIIGWDETSDLQMPTADSYEYYGEGASMSISIPRAVNLRKNALRPESLKSRIHTLPRVSPYQRM